MRAIKSRNGIAVFVDLPEPQIKPQYVKVKITYSSVSVGTELMMIRTNPEAPLGYSAAGIVTEVGEGVTHVKPGQRVACYGTPAHREVMLSPKHLTIPIPDGVSGEEAAFSGIGAIAIHALRQADLRFGETVVVVGAGILGQIIARIANASNYRVIGLEPMEERRSMLNQAGVTDACRDEDELKTSLNALTDGKGADAVLVCASNRKDSLIDSAIRWLRDRGKVVIVGDTGCEIDRDLLFMKEASVHISRAGGPGRYETDYEQLGFDYPIGYVRWTEGRNVQDFLRMLQEQRFDLQSLITDQVAFDELPDMYVRYEQSPQNRMGVVVRID
ncbi:zinc-dependent alcohol dehydrogenase [Paenibacillus mendelii]|uniref:Zinc-binding alcohol dehydrogenase n=1 Tax=Paenibacillus mendelii TaxID=206163 RepID=A0ABV6J370_9BACL|nr:zinc-binding alcohol dehydrogenase [Paenibacillus mendelii]MCQ6559431.1 zinc-binding alcohol dehydrogenase [Paenibacillus mendelii]